MEKTKTEIKTDRFVSCAKTVKEVIKALPIGAEFFGWELKNECVKLQPALKNMYVETFIKTMRMRCREQYICIDHKKSLYKKVEAK